MKIDRGIAIDALPLTGCKRYNKPQLGRRLVCDTSVPDEGMTFTSLMESACVQRIEKVPLGLDPWSRSSLEAGSSCV